jgi:ribosomal protein S18 acetylase RimI-like enzyme
MPMETEVRPMLAAEIPRVCGLVDRVFDRFVAPSYSADGIAEFRKYNDAVAMAQRLGSGHLAWVAAAGEELVGVIEIRNHRHVSLLFVEAAAQGRGVSRALWERALRESQAADPAVREFTVFSSPYAIRVYEKLGFRATGPEESHHGLRFTPMRLQLG